VKKKRQERNNTRRERGRERERSPSFVERGFLL
jgi:hypothetical protein